MTLQELMIRVLQTVEASNLSFMVVGAIAAGAYGVPRSTKDVDLLVAVTDELELRGVGLSRWIFLNCLTTNLSGRNFVAASGYSSRSSPRNVVVGVGGCDRAKTALAGLD